MKKLKLDQLGRLSIGEFKTSKKIPVCILLDNVRSLHNVGSAFRTGDAFSVEKLVLTGITGTPPHREIEKTALGATASVSWTYHENAGLAVAALKAEGWKIVVVEQTTESVQLQKLSTQPGDKLCLVFGNEINGVSDEVIGYADVAIEIPQSGTKHSLNISVCVGIVVWEIYRKISHGSHGSHG
ncbi:MAG TPA: RNA methyltransferase [Cyclobacteriaceae bacterium]|nr:RNA methyltransferase [Cyclobacteriaceae bacterium]